MDEGDNANATPTGSQESQPCGAEDEAPPMAEGVDANDMPTITQDLSDLLDEAAGEAARPTTK
eukprot:12940045-Heterocapsa_arctica.AAC.1